jgi:hypothetical protein
MTTSMVKLEYSLGEIVAIVDVTGNVERSTQVIDHVLAAATTTADIDVIGRSIPGVWQETGARRRHKCIATVELDDVTVTTQVTFTLRQPVSRQVLNVIIFGCVLPKLWEATVLDYVDDQLSTQMAELRPQRVSIEFFGDS